MKNETIFVEIFGGSPVIKVLDFLISYQAFDYSLTEIAKNSGVSYSTLQIFWDKLIKNNIVVKTRRVGKSDLYKLNTKNPFVKELIKLDWLLIEESLITKEIEDEPELRPEFIKRIKEIEKQKSIRVE